VHKLNRVCVFCGSHYGGHSRYERAARELGTKLAQLKICIIYGGGKVGLTGLLADAALAAGGEVIGVMPENERSSMIAHRGLTELLMVGSRHERKDAVAQISDGFIALPGGIGVLDEFTEMAMLTQLGYQHKPCGLLNVNRYFDHLIAHFDLAASEGFTKPMQRRVVQHDSDVERLLAKMRNWDAPD
jgi:uncharacterized protein (TIGR00730 family)